MLVKELVEQLLKMPQDLSVNVFDWRKNLSDDSGEGSYSGIYNELNLSIEGMENKFVAIHFQNEDYNDFGLCLLTNDEEPNAFAD